MTRSESSGASRVGSNADDPGNGNVSSEPAHSARIHEDHHRRTSEHVSEQAAIDNRTDRVRWGPVWAGTLAVLSTFIVLQLLSFALGLLDLGFDGGEGSGVTRGIVTGVLALIAFFVGGMLAGASTMWRGAGDGLLHGVLVWALSVLGIVALALIGGSSLLGPLADLAGQSGVQPQNANVDVDTARVLNAARHTAGWTALGLGLAVAAAALGGVSGSKIWPGREDENTDTPVHSVKSASSTKP